MGRKTIPSTWSQAVQVKYAINQRTGVMCIHAMHLWSARTWTLDLGQPISRKISRLKEHQFEAHSTILSTYIVAENGMKFLDNCPRDSVLSLGWH